MLKYKNTPLILIFVALDNLQFIQIACNIELAAEKKIRELADKCRQYDNLIVICI